MAKFCTKCGKPLEDGKACECEKVEVKKIESNSSNGIGDLFKDYFEIIKKFFKKPIDTLKENDSEDKFNVALVSIAVTGISMGIFMCSIIKKLLGMFSGMIEIPYLKVFIIGFAAIVLMIVVLALITYLVSDKLFKGPTSIKKMFVLFGLSSIILAACILTSTVLLLIDLDIQIIYIILSLGSLLWLVYNVLGIAHFSKINVNNIGYTLILSYGATLFVVYYLLKEILIQMFL